jgi:hypothetical protein
MVACGDRSNSALNALESLVAKHIISKFAETGAVRARHHVIAEVLRDKLIAEGRLGDVPAAVELTG